MTRRNASFALVFAMLLLSACASLGRRLEPPEVSLIAIEPLPSHSFEQRFEITVRIINPNEVPLAGDGLDITLDLNGRRLARALSSERFVIPRLGDDVVKLVATTNLLDLFRQAVTLPEAGQLDYTIEGRVLLANSMAWLRFSRQGNLLPKSIR